MHSLNKGNSVHQVAIGSWMVEGGVVPHRPDDFLHPGGATFGVRHQHHVTVPPLVAKRTLLPANLAKE